MTDAIHIASTTSYRRSTFPASQPESFVEDNKILQLARLHSIAIIPSHVPRPCPAI
jgi:hypothetical protein